MIAKTVCFIEDDDAYMFLIKTILRGIDGYDIKILSFGDGKQAADYYSANAENETALPDAIFLDLNMPVMDGWEFLDFWNSLQPRLKKKVPLYVHSSSISQKDIQQAKGQSLVVDFIEKPMEEEVFLKTIK